jgi:hypothetical protein
MCYNVWIVGNLKTIQKRGSLRREPRVGPRSAPAGILLSAATFGAAHAYQGLRMAILIAVYGAMFGMLAYGRGSVRPGMIAQRRRIR